MTDDFPTTSAAEGDWDDWYRGNPVPALLVVVGVVAFVVGAFWMGVAVR